MSKMGLLGAISFSLALASLTQIRTTDGCHILSATPTGPSSILVKWESLPQVMSYMLDLRVKNEENIAPVVVRVHGTQKNVQGLRPGKDYVVTVKGFFFMERLCEDSYEASTVPDTAQIEVGRSLNSTSIYLEWTPVPSAEIYILHVIEQLTGTTLNFNYTESSATVNDLKPSTHYNCYIYTGNHAGTGGRSRVKTITTRMRPPDYITAEQTGMYVSRVSWEAVENVLIYRFAMENIDNPADFRIIQNVTDNEIVVNGVLPCSRYLITVSSYNYFLLPSETRDYTYFTNSLPPVPEVMVDYNCAVNSAKISWVSVSGASSYVARALPVDGSEKTCTSSANSCDISGMDCGQTYEVHVLPVSQNCETSYDTTTTFHTVPCPPGNLKLERNCSSEVIVFSWDHTPDTSHYVAKGVDSKGVVRTCVKEENVCMFTQPVCGREYSFTVSSVTEDKCLSEASYSVNIRTAPCIPENFQISSKCESNNLLSTWDHAEGALRYTVKAYGNRVDHSFLNCSSETNSCLMTEGTCGQHMSVYIQASDNECSSPWALGPVPETVPCTPQNVTVVADCGDSLRVAWLPSQGAFFYIVNVEDNNGNVHSFYDYRYHTSITELKCNTMYTVTVVSSNILCNSSDSEPVSLTTGACPPHDVTATLDCGEKKVLVAWMDDRDSSSFTATIEDEDSNLLSCSSTTASCWIENLQCGKVYKVTVRHHDGICPGMPSEEIFFDSVPCGPANLSADVACQWGGMTVNWLPSTNALGYTVMLSDGTTESTHQTTEPTFSISPQDCGMEYTVSVLSYSGSCDSFPSTITVTEAPCMPGDVVAERNCGQSFMEVSWSASHGAKTYIVSAASDGHTLTCTSNETSCNVEGVTCSQVYSITVAAEDDYCVGPSSPSMDQITAPCPPTDLSAAVDCASESALLTWQSSTNAVSYTGKAESTDGHSLTCDGGAGNSCQIDGLLCGKEYSFTVSASDGFCETPDSEPFIYSTAPCIVQNVVATPDCSTNSLSVSWTAQSVPLNYSVEAVGTNGHELHYVTEDSSSTLPGLECGQEYTVTVKAASSTCEGQRSVPQTVHSAPCPPVNVQGVVDCATHILHASWDPPCPTCDVSFVTTLIGEGDFSTTCSSDNTDCSFPDLQCAQTYTLSVVANNDICSSAESAAVSTTTAPCEPTYVNAALDCSSGHVAVTWGASAGATSYTVLAEAEDGHHNLCTSDSTTCDLIDLHCGENYTVTVLAGNGQCNSSSLTSTSVTTVPCAPVILDHDLDCVSNTAVVMWSEDGNAASITVTATSDTGSPLTCTSAEETSCSLTNLQCGHTYTVHAVAEGGAECPSQASTTTQIVTAPCASANVDSSYSCETGIALITWDETLGVESFYAQAQSGDHTVSCSTTDTTECLLSSLHCGSTYNVEVIAVADHCNSSAPGVTQFQTAPCPPTNVETSLVCENNTAAVSWESSSATSHYVLAIGGNGDVKECSSTDNSCLLPELNCGQTYEITVTPTFGQCQGTASSAFTLVAAPCPPTNVQASLECLGNRKHVTWDAVLGAELYVVTSVDGDHEHTCSSTDTTCSLTDVECGVTSVITVVSVVAGCSSQHSQFVTLQSVLCPPSTVTGEANCDSHDITVTWGDSPQAGINYHLYYTDNTGQSNSYYIDEVSYMLTWLECGVAYDFSVGAKDATCDSAMSMPIHTETAPCPPATLHVTTECGTNLGVMIWEETFNAVSYTVTATGEHGGVASCSSNTTTCSMKLDCGRQYTAVVMASGMTCDSGPGASVTFTSAACLPADVVAEMNCDINSIVVQWTASEGYNGAYTAMAIGSDDTRETCETTGTTCIITGLECGLTYSIVVSTPVVNCASIDGSDYLVQTAPCPPQNVLMDLQCSDNVAVVSWEDSGPNQVQVVTAVDSHGDPVTCTSSGSSCTFDQLACGETYAISVASHTDSCHSEPTLSETLITAPCAPTHIEPNINCWTGVTTITWDAALGATSYTVYADGALGHSDSHTVADNTWPFDNLLCGQNYNFSVVAHHDSCDSSVSEVVMTHAVPCPHTELQNALNCDTNTAVVSWLPGTGIVQYNAMASASNTAHQVHCLTNGTTCNITSLHCGESYIVSVTGEGDRCKIQTQDLIAFTTAPCAPTNAVASFSCDSNSVMVSWHASQGSLSYVALAEDDKGTQWSCESSSTSCEISNLPCGQQYKVSVVGVDDHCTGPKSNIEVVTTAPCVPLNVQNHFDCLTDVLNITWESTGHFLRFHASVEGSNGDVLSCTTEEHDCVVSNLQCDLTYTITVVAEDSACSSSQSSPSELVSAPCPQSTFEPTVDCAAGHVFVNWFHSAVGAEYTVSAVDALENVHNCIGTVTGCNLDALKCGTQYDISITPSKDGCVGKPSHSQIIRTPPCAPVLSDVEIDCLSNSAWMMFEESTGAESYVPVVSNTSGLPQSFECAGAIENTCSLPVLQCSTTYTFTLMARGPKCDSPPSNPITKDTAPCPPENVDSAMICGNSAISVEWSPVGGALMYTVTMEEMDQMNGPITCCTTPDTSCNVEGLPCGEFYNVHVMAEGQSCNGSLSEGFVTKTAPCPPFNVRASVSCSTNVATVSWSTLMGGQLYRVTAVDSDGQVHECTSFFNQCDLNDLPCGQLYTATVIAEDANCSSPPSENVIIKTVPCTPESISSEVDCDANALVVSWSESMGADVYIVTVEDSDGQTTTCQGTTEGSCSLEGLICGQIYRAHLVASDGYCNSPPTTSVEVPPVPCTPSNIVSYFSCHSWSAMVSWQPSDGVSSYLVEAVAISGGTFTNETTSTSCEMTELQCGESYTVTVSAVGQVCSGTVTMMNQLVTGPCVPDHVTTEYSWSVGQVMWDASAGADSYSVTLQSPTDENVMCEGTENYCSLNGLLCSQSYMVTVTASNAVCQDTFTSEAAVIETEPCPPNIVEASVQCKNNVGTVAWESSIGAVSYMVFLNGRNGHSLFCSTEELFCSIEDLHCGVVYYTNAIAVGAAHNSSVSTTVNLVAAPCMDVSLTAELSCDSTANISWTEVSGANSYMVSAVSNDGYQALCEAAELHCQLSDLQCGQTYRISITVVDDNCQVEVFGTTFSSHPCKPENVGVNLPCGSLSADVTWVEVEGVEFYMVTATCNEDDDYLECNSTTSATCHLSNLHCGHTYKVSVSAYAHGCWSESSSPVLMEIDPCQPTGLTVTGSCDSETVVLDWSETDGASVYIVMAEGSLGSGVTVQTNETTFESELPCGQVYTITVTALNNRCLGPASLPEEFRTAPCVPVNVHSFTECEYNRGSVSWAPSDGADSYLAMAVGHDDHSHPCDTSTTICNWDDLHCGEIYSVSVVARDAFCTSAPSNVTTIRMAPCIPQNVVASLNCTTKVGSLNWDTSETADFYLVKAETNSGHKVEVSTNDTWTFISEFLCGEEYFLSVQAVDSVCSSQYSPPKTLLSVPCPPTGISSFMNCLSNIALVSWTKSAGAEFYSASISLEDDQPILCWSSGDECSMPNVNCGQNYRVTVVASNPFCTSDESEADSLQSVPCVPTDVIVEMDCFENEATVSWSASEGALTYSVSAQSTLGDVVYCESTGLQCTLTGLVCGRAYNVQVNAMDDICSSLPSPRVPFLSVPCTPVNTSAVLDCWTNSALFEWSYTEGAIEYIAIATASWGHTSTCGSNTTNCELDNLQCGQIYEAVVSASNGQCKSPPSAAVQVESVPCPPTEVEAVVDCSANTAQVAWQASMGADSYTVYAVCMSGHEGTCETTTQSCSITDLLCGCTYNISVVSTNEVCHMSESGKTEMQSVPCATQHVEAIADCQSRFVTVSWEPSLGALSYEAIAQGNGGYDSTCRSSSSETACTFDNLLCGLNYSVIVTASDELCPSLGSTAVEFNTLPCEPQNLEAKMFCNNDSAEVMWEEEEGVSSYSVQAVGPEGHLAECSDSGHYCFLESLHCGQLYNLMLTAQDGRCDNTQAFLQLQSVPCSPTSVNAELECSVNTLVVTWEQASGAMSYRTVGVTEDGSHQVECTNTETNCDLSELHCGQTYMVSVFGLDEDCSSVESDVSYVRTAPCAPEDVSATTDCPEPAISVSWTPNPDAEHFLLMAVSDSGTRLYCETTNTSCTLTDVPCGQTYSVGVKAVRDGCESQMSTLATTSSAPCAPSAAAASSDCVSNSAYVTWDAAEGATHYSVHAEEAGGHNSSCTSSVSPCEVPDLNCGTIYTLHVTAMNAHCYSVESSITELVTDPCDLTSISASTECGSDTILVEWENQLDTHQFLVIAEDTNHEFSYCNSTSDSCVLENMQCDMHYSIITAATSTTCNTLHSPPARIDTAPCRPSEVTVEHLCEEDAALVRWSHSPVAVSYEVMARADGHLSNCHSFVNNCTLSDLHCGLTYTMSIVAHGHNCSSTSSFSSFTTAPCPPTSAVVFYNCESRSAILSWTPTEGAENYYAFSQPREGEALYCDTEESVCTFKNLECGEIYTFSVKASNRVCNSSLTGSVVEGAVPCHPKNKTVWMQKSQGDYWAMTKWDAVSCPDVKYQVEITGPIGNNPLTLMEVHSYWLTRPYYEVPIPCSTPFSLTVRARNPAGVSTDCVSYRGMSVPCAPQNLVYTGNEASAVLSWDMSHLATKYMVYSTEGGDRITLCETDELFCTLSNFNSSATEVTASNDVGESDPNSDISGPILNRRRRDLKDPLVLVMVRPDLESPNVTVSAIGRSLHVKWMPVDDATEYTVLFEELTWARQSSQSLTVITMEGSEGSETDLKPWTTYCVRVAAKNALTQSTYSNPICKTTGASERYESV